MNREILDQKWWLTNNSNEISRRKIIPSYFDKLSEVFLFCKIGIKNESAKNNDRVQTIDLKLSTKTRETRLDYGIDQFQNDKICLIKQKIEYNFFQ